jgi:hypothetical protein
MNPFKLLGKAETSVPSPIQDPFKQNCINSISIRLSTWSKVKTWTATLEFKNGNTGGSFKTKEYPVDQFEDCVQELRELIKTLPS